jgi:hypothetical protein
VTHEKESDMISIHDILAFIAYEKYFWSVERAEERKACTAAPQRTAERRILWAGDTGTTTSGPRTPPS